MIKESSSLEARVRQLENASKSQTVISDPDTTSKLEKLNFEMRVVLAYLEKRHPGISDRIERVRAKAETKDRVELDQLSDVLVGWE